MKFLHGGRSAKLIGGMARPQSFRANSEPSLFIRRSGGLLNPLILGFEFLLIAPCAIISIPLGWCSVWQLRVYYSMGEFDSEQKSRQT
jgi:hypothetical protein